MLNIRSLSKRVLIIHCLINLPIEVMSDILLNVLPWDVRAFHDLVHMRVYFVLGRGISLGLIGILFF